MSLKLLTSSLDEKSNKAETECHQLKGTKPTMKESVRSGMPVSFTQASMTPWISAVMVEPEERVAPLILTTNRSINADNCLSEEYPTYRWWRRSLPPRRNRPRCWCIWPRCVATAPPRADPWAAVHPRWCCLETFTGDKQTTSTRTPPTQPHRVLGTLRKTFFCCCCSQSFGPKWMKWAELSSYVYYWHIWGVWVYFYWGSYKITVFYLNQYG